ncbi:MAG TPA: HIT family protein [Candidatus Binatia bacterium]|nr:HIT family protein [Candidatus Binatia bacterium]
MDDAGFELHPQLAADTLPVGDAPLCRVLLMNDARWPWCILVPRRAGVREIYELSDADQQQLLRESSRMGRALMQRFDGEKLNVAALGNVVPQLHVHHVVRHAADPAWPAPVWGRPPAQPYEERAARERVTLIAEALAGLLR